MLKEQHSKHILTELYFMISKHYFLWKLTRKPLQNVWNIIFKTLKSAKNNKIIKFILLFFITFSMISLFFADILGSQFCSKEPNFRRDSGIFTAFFHKFVFVWITKITKFSKFYGQLFLCHILSYIAICLDSGQL